MLNLFTRTPEWLRPLLGLQEPTIVHEMETGSAIGTVDLLSAGIRDDEAYRFHGENTLPGTGALNEWSIGSGGVVVPSGGSTGASNVLDLTQASIVLVSVVNNGAANQLGSSYSWASHAGEVPDSVRLGISLALNGNNALTHAAITGSPRPWYLPPGFVLAVATTSTAAQSQTFQYQGIRLPRRSLDRWL